MKFLHEKKSSENFQLLRNNNLDQHQTENNIVRPIRHECHCNQYTSNVKSQHINFFKVIYLICKSFVDCFFLSLTKNGLFKSFVEHVRGD